MKKTVSIILISFLTLIVIGMSVLFVMILNGNIRIDGLKFKLGIKNSYIEEIAIDEVYENTFDGIDIHATAGSINIYTSKEDNIRLVINNKKKNTIVNTDLNTLNIDVKAKKCNFFCINPKIAKIDLYLPINFDKEIKITTEYGDIKIENFKDANFNIKSNYGDITIYEANYANLDLDYGDVKIDEVNELVVTTNYGDIKLGTVNDLTAISDYGDIKVQLVTSSLTIECDCGDVKINTVNLTKDSMIKNNFGDVKIKSIKRAYIDAKTSVGDVKVKDNDRTSDKTLTIRNDCGDIEVN